MTGTKDFFILHIDDNSICNFILESGLKQVQSSICMEFGRSGEEGIEILKRRLRELGSTKFMPDMILVDINMPAMTGIDFVKSIVHEFGPPAIEKTKICFNSISLSPKSMMEMQTLDVTYQYIEKPVKEKKLVEILTS